MIKYIVFDWDGTLVNTVPFLEKTFNHTFETLQIPAISYDKIRHIASNCEGQGVFAAVFGKERCEEAKKIFYEYTQKHHLEMLEAFRYAEEVIRFCVQNGLRCYILSNKKSDVLKQEVEHLGWSSYFYKISGAGEYAIDKPAKEPCFALFDNNIPQSNEILVVGDSPTDIKMAKVWNCSCVIIKSGRAYRGIKADYKLESLAEFIPLIQSMLY
ncbi:MAG: HAD family hydrolase [Alphaproteobacteria bacterium]